MVMELNQEMHEMKRRHAIGVAFKLIYFLVIIVSLGGAYYFISPLLETVIGSQDKIKNIIETFDLNALKGESSSSDGGITITPELLEQAKKVIESQSSQ